MSRLAVLLLALAASASAARAQFTPAVPLPGDTTPGIAAGQQEKSAIAFGGAHYLAVWEDGTSALGGFVSPPDGIHPNRNVLGMLLDANGDPALARPIVVNQSPWDQLDPRVAWNGSTYLVVWESTRPNQFYRTQGVYAARVDASGAVLDDPPIVIDDGDDEDERWPVVASDGQGWMVAWMDAASSAGQKLQGAYVDASGLVLFQRTLVPTSTPYPTNYEVAYAQGRFAVTFEKSYASIAARLYDTALLQVGTEISLSGTGSKPAIGSNDAGFYVAWRGSGIRGSTLSTSGAVGTSGGIALSGTFSLGDPTVAVAWDGASWVATFNGYSDAYAAQVDPSGALQAGSPFHVSGPVSYLHEMATANGAGKALACWTDWRSTTYPNVDPFDVNAARILPSATVSSAFPLTIAPPAQTEPSLAGDAQAGYLLAFARRSSGSTQIVGQRVDGGGNPVDLAPFVIADGLPSLGGVDVAWDGAEWLVAWHVLANPTAPVLWRTSCRRVGANGLLLDAAPVDLMTGRIPTVSAVAGVFLVATHFHYPPVASNERYHFKRVRGSDGVVLDASEVILIYASGTSDSVGFDDRWLLAFSGSRTQFVMADGTVLPPVYTANTGSSGGSARMSLARNGDEALLVWEYDGSLVWNSDLRARRIQKDGTLLDLETGTFVSSGPNGQILPRAAWSGSRYLVTFTDFRAHPTIEPGIGDVYAVRVSSSNEVLDAAEIPIQSRWPVAEGRSAIAGDAGIVLIATPVLDDGPFGTWRILMQRFQEETPWSTVCPGDGTAAACPCANTSPIGFGEGCLHSLGTGARLEASGAASIAADSLSVAGSRMPNSTALYFQGTSQAGGGLGTAFGDGVRCASGSILRLGTKTNSAGASRYPLGADAPISVRGNCAAGDTRTYQIWFRNAAAFCTSSTFNLSNGITLTWVP